MPENTRTALLASLRVLESLADRRQLDGRQLDGHPPNARRPDRAFKYDGSIEYTFEDEEYEPFGRAIDVRIYYRWSNYNPADDPWPMWGATIEDWEVLAVRYFDNAGNEVPEADHFTDVAWHLLNKNYEQVTEACTEDGYRRGAGNAPITYAPGRLRSKVVAPAKPDFGPRMVPSIPTRSDPLGRGQTGRRQLG